MPVVTALRETKMDKIETITITPVDFRPLPPASLTNEEITDWIAETASKRAFRCFSVLSDLIEEFSEGHAQVLLGALVADPAIAGTLLRAKLVTMVERDCRARGSR
jgi:hypothetical protein